VRDCVAHIVYDVPWQKFVKQGAFIDGDLCPFSKLECALKTFGDPMGPRYQSLPKIVSSMQGHRMKLECWTGLGPVDTTALRQVQTIEFMSPELVTATEWKSGELHRNAYYLYHLSHYVQYVHLPYSGTRDVNESAVIAHTSGEVDVKMANSHTRYASMYDSLVRACHDTKLRALRHALRNAISLPRVSNLVRAFEYGSCAQILHMATNTVKISPRLGPSMDIRSVDPRMLHLVDTECCRCLFLVLWRRNFVVFQHGLCFTCHYC